MIGKEFDDDLIHGLERNLLIDDAMDTLELIVFQLQTDIKEADARLQLLVQRHVLALSGQVADADGREGIVGSRDIEVLDGFLVSDFRYPVAMVDTAGLRQQPSEAKNRKGDARDENGRQKKECERWLFHLKNNGPFFKVRQG